jgi:hypothetical protein
MSAQTTHRWSFHHARAAGLVGVGMTRGLSAHRARGTADGVPDLLISAASGDRVYVVAVARD